MPPPNGTPWLLTAKEKLKLLIGACGEEVTGPREKSKHERDHRRRAAELVFANKLAGMVSYRGHSRLHYQGDNATPGNSNVGKVASGSITAKAIASVANNTMAINPKFKSEDRRVTKDDVRRASRDRRCRPDMAASPQ